MSKTFTNDNPTTKFVTTNPAVVTVGTVDFGSAGDTLAKYTADNRADTENPVRYKVRNRYEDDRHIYMMGITSPNEFAGATAAFVQLANPTLLWISEWTLASFNRKPAIPNSDTMDNNWVLLDRHMDPYILTVGTDGVTPLYSISGMYVYGCRKPDPDAYKNMIFPRPVWLQDVFERKITITDFEQGIINVVKDPGFVVSKS